MVRIKEEKVVEIPPRNPPLSSDCRDLLTRCLVRSPEKRIDFSDFFDHPFLDLEHFPDQDSVQRASKIASEAVAADKSKDRERAAELYEEALNTCVSAFVEILHSLQCKIFKYTFLGQYPMKC